MDRVESAVRIVVCDAGPLIHLDEVGSIELLSDFQQVLVSPTVSAEVKLHRPAAFGSSKVNYQFVSPMVAMSAELAAIARLFALHQGELEALQLATGQSGILLLTDDASARLAARHLAVPVRGTIGILLRSIRRGQLTKSQVVDMLRSLPTKSTLHLKQSLLDEIVEVVEQMR
jgi:predicted nucleic acid-binding protein